MNFLKNLKSASNYILERVGSFDIALVLGSGLAGFVPAAFKPASGDEFKGLSEKEIIDRGGSIAIPYKDIPHMPLPTVSGHTGKLICGKLGDNKVLCFSGRFHSYEGYTGTTVTLLPRLAALCGCKTYVLTNAAGGARGPPGHVMIITDHVNMARWSPLECSTHQFGFKSFEEKNLYSEEMAAKCRKICAKIDFTCHEGVYAWMSGPSYETPAEITALKEMGVGAFGMSSVPEAQAAADAGLEVFGLSLITNLAAGISKTALNHAEVKEVATMAGKKMNHLMITLLGEHSPSLANPEKAKEFSVAVDDVMKPIAESDEIKKFYSTVKPDSRYEIMQRFPDFKSELSSVMTKAKIDLTAPQVVVACSDLDLTHISETPIVTFPLKQFSFSPRTAQGLLGSIMFYPGFVVIASPGRC
ncbi:Purine nucleoside phosphorylase like protein, partial [Aduncisulcus paluster]